MEPLIGWRSGARKKFQVKDARHSPSRDGRLSTPYARTAFGGGLRAVLELKFVLRKIASKPSMIGSRTARGLSHIRLNPDSQHLPEEGLEEQGAVADRVSRSQRARLESAPQISFITCA
jgi:hypothetical protein